MERALEFMFTAARSNFPSPLKSAEAIPHSPVGPKFDLLSEVKELGSETGKNARLDVPPPGPGLTTVTEAVPAFAISEAGMVAVNCELLIKAVARALPFQVNAEPEIKPVPFTVSLNPAPPGATASGTRG